MTQEVSLTETQQYWLEHIRACSKSGLTMKAYAEAYALSATALYAWKKTLRRKGVIEGPRTDRPGLFCKAVISEHRPGRARVLLPTGIVLELDSGTDPLWASAMVRALS